MMLLQQYRQMCRTIWSFILVLQPLLLLLRAIQPYNNIPSTNSGTNTIYNGTSALALGTIITFNVNYPTPHRNNPKLMLGLIGYEQRGDMIDSVFQLNQGTSTLAAFTIQVMCAGTSAVYMFRISYISLEDVNGAFYTFWLAYNNLTVVSTGSGQRTEAKTGNSFYTLSGGKTFNSNLTINKAYAFIRGFQLQSVSGDFRIQVSVQITNTISFTTYVKTSSDCRIQNVQIMHVFVDPGKFTTQLLFIYNQFVLFQEGNMLVSLPSHFTSFGHVLMGLTQMRGYNVRGGAIIKFNLGNSTSGLALEITQNVIQTVQLNYVFLALNQCNSFDPYYTSPAKEGCTSQCLSGQVQSPSSKVCQSCTSPCQQCTTTATNCSACVDKYSMSSGQCTKIVVVQASAQPASQLYLLGLLSVIPVAIIFCCFLKKRRQKFKIHIADIVIQPSIDFS